MKYSDLCKPLTRKEEKLSPDVWMTRSRGFIRREGARRRRVQRAKMTETTMWGSERRGRGTHPWRKPPTMTISTAPLPLDRVLLLITPKPPRTTMTKRGACWEYLSSGYAQWDTWRLYLN